MNTQPTLAQESTIADWIRIARAEIAPRKLRPLLEAYEFSAAALLKATSGQWSSHAPRMIETEKLRLSQSARDSVDDAMRIIEKQGVSAVPINHPDYPANLREIDDASPVLFVRGTLKADDRFSIAVVGSRRATAYGLSIAERFSRDLAARGLCIVSGGARGIDTFSHRGALKGGGRTVVFLGCGIGTSYPPENRHLFDEVVSSGQGAIVSEYVPGVEPSPWRFPARNRLISGMTMGTFVIESPIDSGAMITASDAASQGRDVFAVPGPIETGRSAGCHRLIQEGAKLVETPDDILKELGFFQMGESLARQPSLPGFNAPPEDLDTDQRLILDRLTLQPQSVDALLAGIDLSAAQVSAVLTILEMRGLTRRLPGNAFVRVL
ncbi:MAG: DNA-processing protein DprA [Capsulimonadaceae bacterium]|nr:DNA-processing protein DprA [Capsulimonadaceae bacterium]